MTNSDYPESTCAVWQFDDSSASNSIIIKYFLALLALIVLNGWQLEMSVRNYNIKFSTLIYLVHTFFSYKCRKLMNIVVQYGCWRNVFFISKSVLQRPRSWQLVRCYYNSEISDFFFRIYSLCIFVLFLLHTEMQKQLNHDTE